MGLLVMILGLVLFLGVHTLTTRRELRAQIIATPRLTYSTAGVSTDTRAAYLKAINASLDACMPLKFTGGLGGALAGRPIAIRYVDNRELGKQSGTP